MKKKAQPITGDYELVTLRVTGELATFVERVGTERVVEILQAYATNTFNRMAMAEEPKKPLLQRANELIGGDRQQDYGNKLQNFSQIAMLWQGTLAPKLQADAKITPEDVALLMMQVKIARLAKSPDHEDSILDVAGYAGCYEAVQNERASGYPLLGATKDARQ